MNNETSKELTDEQKLWFVVSRIKEATVGQSRNNCHILIWDFIQKGMKVIEIYNIFSKLEDDEKVIEIISKPKKLTNDPYDYENTDIVVKVLNKFATYYKKLATIFGLSIENLNDMNCLKVVDVITEIEAALNFTDKNTIRIPLWQPIIRFRPLMPADTIGMRDRYCQFRHETIEFLKKIGVVEDFEVIQNGHRWENEIEITVGRLRLVEVAEEIDKRWVKIPLEDRRMAVGFKPEEIKAEDNKSEDKQDKNLSYNSKECSLTIGQYKVQIAKNTDQSELCRVIFGDNESMMKCWSYDEIHKSWKGIDNYNPKSWGKYYHAAYGVNEKVEKATQIKKFLVHTKNDVKVNEIYLEKYLNNQVESGN